MAGVGFSGGKSGRNPEKSNSGICWKSKTAAIPLPDDPDIEGTGCLSLQIRGGVFVGGGLADVPESGKPPEKIGGFLQGLCFPSGDIFRLLLGCLMGCVCPHKNIVKKGKCTGVGASPAPLCKGWCSAQRIKIEMIAGGNHTIICAAPVRTLGLRGSELSSFRALSIKRGFTIPQSRACVRRASQLPLHKGAVGCSRTSALFRRVPAQKNRVPKNRDAAEICAIQAISP